MKRFTKKGGLDFTDKNLSLVDVLGYSYIYNHLAELEDKIESRQLIELPTIISFSDTHPYLGKITIYQVIWLDELLGIRHENYIAKEKANVKLKELKEK